MADTTKITMTQDSQLAAHEGKNARAPKGRPTPKRNQAQKNHRTPTLPPPMTRAEARARKKELRPKTKAEKRSEAQQRRAKNAENRARMLAGEENYLLAKDKGPIRRFARECVDSRKSISNYMMPSIFMILFLTIFFQTDPVLISYASPITVVLLAIFVLDALITAIITVRKVRQKFPKELIPGFSLGFYAFGRSTQLPKMRIPRPDPQLKK